MYKAQILYPKKQKEFVYLSDSVKARLSSVKAVKAKGHLSLSEYFELAELHGWNISRDINYAYAEVVYPPEEIKRRLMRATGSNITNALEDIAFACSLSFSVCESVARYGKKRTVHTYAKMMFELSEWEKSAGYPDALDFEE